MICTLETCCWLYNYFLEERKTMWNQHKKSTTFYDQCNSLINLKKLKPELSKIYSQTLQDVAKKIDNSFYKFFNKIKKKEKAGYPRIKSLPRYKSFAYPQFEILGKIKDNKIYLPKIGWVKIKLHRKIKGFVKKVLIKKTSTNKWYAIIVCEDYPIEKLPLTNLQIGVDVGLNKFATLSSGEVIENPKFFEKKERILIKLQKQQKRKASCHVREKIKNKKLNFHHQEARKLLNKYDTIYIEKLDINSMKKCGKFKFGKAVSDVAWGNFIRLLKYKAEDAGKKIIEVPPFFTSQTCSKCSHLNKTKAFNFLMQCDKCGHTESRDLNAAKNILRLGTQSLKVKCPLKDAKLLAVA